MESPGFSKTQRPDIAAIQCPGITTIHVPSNAAMQSHLICYWDMSLIFAANIKWGFAAEMWWMKSATD